MANREPPLPHGLSQVFSQSIGGGGDGGEGEDVALVVVTNDSSVAMNLGRVLWPGLWCERWGDEAEVLIRLPPSWRTPA